MSTLSNGLGPLDLAQGGASIDTPFFFSFCAVESLSLVALSQASKQTKKPNLESHSFSKSET